jgi:oligopeptidase A
MRNPLLDTSSLPRFADIAPEHVVPALEQLIETQRGKLEKLLESTIEPDFDSLVAPLEDMEHELSRVWSPVSHLQGVLGSREWRDAYNAALPILTEYGTEISQNARLQQAYASVDSSLPEDASEARRSAVAHALRDFRLAGVDLPDEDKARFRPRHRPISTTTFRTPPTPGRCTSTTSGTSTACRHRLSNVPPLKRRGASVMAGS